MTDVAEIAKDEVLTPDETGGLKALHEAASCGDWRIDRGMMSNDLHITSWMRERSFNEDDDDRDPICWIQKERTIYRTDKYNGGSTSRKHPIKTAEADAKLIVAMKNKLPRLLNTLIERGGADETAWLIEWPANKHNTIRYWSVGEEAVMSVNDATCLARKADAEAVIQREQLKGCRAAEHKWVTPKLAESVA